MANTHFCLSAIILGWLGSLIQNPDWQSSRLQNAAIHDGREKASRGSYTGDEIDWPGPHAPTSKEQKVLCHQTQHFLVIRTNEYSRDEESYDL